MKEQEALDRILARVTPDRLRDLILDLDRRQPIHRESGVSLPDLMDALCERVDLGSGPEAWSAQLRLKKAIVDTLALIPDMRFVEGDA